MNSKSIVSFLALICPSLFLQAEPVTYTIDPVHSGIEFKIRHFINKVPGTFGQFSGTIHFDKENPENSKAEATIHVSSIDTRNEDRDAHLQNEDFFTSSQNPLITFASTSWKATGDNTYQVTGLLEMAGQKNPVVLAVTYLGEMEGKEKFRSGWEGTATIDRTDWGMSYGTPMVGEEVEIELNIQAHRQKPE